jgi:hypothetical protein
MTPEIYRMELAQRGFTFNRSTNQWHGPFGLTVSGYLNHNDPLISPGLRTDNDFARVATLQQLDEQLRARRGLPRPPLIRPVDEFTPNFTPQQPILPPTD